MRKIGGREGEKVDGDIGLGQLVDVSRGCGCVQGHGWDQDCNGKLRVVLQDKLS